MVFRPDLELATTKALASTIDAVEAVAGLALSLALAKPGPHASAPAH